MPVVGITLHTSKGHVMHSGTGDANSRILSIHGDQELTHNRFFAGVHSSCSIFDWSWCLHVVMYILAVWYAKRRSSGICSTRARPMKRTVALGVGLSHPEGPVGSPNNLPLHAGLLTRIDVYTRLSFLCINLSFRQVGSRSSVSQKSSPCLLWLFVTMGPRGGNEENARVLHCYHHTITCEYRHITAVAKSRVKRARHKYMVPCFDSACLWDWRRDRDTERAGAVS